MEEQKEQKKTKIKKIIKIIGFTILGALLSIMLLGTCKKTNAFSSYENYNYQYIVRLTNKSNYNSNYYVISISMEYYFDNGTWNKGNNLDLEGYETYVQKVLSTEDGLSISQTNFTIGSSYLVKGTFDYDQERYNIYSATTIGIYLDKLTTDNYNNGYGTGLDSSQTQAWQQGYDKAQGDLQQSYDNALNSLTEQYNDGVQSLNDEINRLEEQLNNRNLQWGSYKSLLGLIVTYPIQLFKEGLNVNLFGVNIGQLILGLGILIILFSIISFIIGGRLGGSKNE